MNAPEEHNTPDEDTYQRVTVQQHVEQAIYNNVNHVFTEAELRRAEKIPGSMKLKAGEWLKYPPRVAMVKSVQMLTATYKRRDRWGTVLYKPAVFPDDNFLSA